MSVCGYIEFVGGGVTQHGKNQPGSILFFGGFVELPPPQTQHRSSPKKLRTFLWTTRFLGVTFLLKGVGGHVRVHDNGFELLQKIAPSFHVNLYVVLGTSPRRARQASALYDVVWNILIFCVQCMFYALIL